MTFPLGIGIITYNRETILRDTIDQVRALTRQPGTAIVAADDGSTDGTLQLLRQKSIPVVTGVNMGIAWNKNRALFLLAQMLGCETVILLEDDVRPNKPGWEADWMGAVRRWGHVNLMRDWMKAQPYTGSGSASDPYRSIRLTAQCSAYSRAALVYAGYFDTRFKGYGHEHVEHTRRLCRVGYGGLERHANRLPEDLFYSIDGSVDVMESGSFYDADQEKRNMAVAERIIDEQGYRAPWGDDASMRQFRSEIETAMIGGIKRFILNPA